MYEVIFVRNSAKAYVKNPRVFLSEKSAKRGLMKSSSHYSTGSVSVSGARFFISSDSFTGSSRR